MNFVTVSFAFFFALVLLVHAFVRKGTISYKTLLLIFNVFFYASAGMTFLPLLLLVAVLNWLTVGLVQHYKDKKKTSQCILGVNIAIHMALLLFYKYYEFFLTNLEDFLHTVGLSIPLYDIISSAEFLFPIGLSFYTFQGLSYAIDQYRNPTAKVESFFNVFLFVSFFPTILAGPILRAKDFFPQLRGETAKNPELIKTFLPKNFEDTLDNREQDVILGFTFIISGLFKKIVLASYLSEHIVHNVFSTPHSYSSLTVLVGVYAYAMQIYCDFSGYSDLAVGVGRLMGYRLPQNFNAPYLALSLQDFWRRWHITLSTWLRDYLYIPLGGSRKGSKTVNLIITMTLGGLWHGSHLRFLIWGVMHGIGLAFVHAWQGICALFGKDTSQGKRSMGETKNEERHNFFKSKIFSIPYALVCWFLTFHFVCVLWIFFRADSAEIAMQMIERIALWDTQGGGFEVLVLVAIFCTMLTQMGGAHLFRAFVSIIHKQWAPLQITVFVILCALILKLGPDGVLPFIYFQF